MEKSNTEITQKAGINSETTQIGIQYNYNGLSVEDAIRIMNNLFFDNFPKLKEIAQNTVNERFEELKSEILKSFSINKINDFSPFSDPDVQYILFEAQKSYARFGTKEMLGTLAELITKRIQCNSEFRLKIVIDQAIKIVPKLSPEQMDFLSLLFICTKVKFQSIKDIISLKAHWAQLCNAFKNADFTAIGYLNMMGCLSLALHDICNDYSKNYNLDKTEIERECPNMIKQLTGDYSVSYIGILIGIVNAEKKTNLLFNLLTWIN